MQKRAKEHSNAIPSTSRSKTRTWEDRRT